MPQLNVRRVAALLAVLAVSLVLGVADVTAANSAANRMPRVKLTILSTSPSSPVAGQNYTMSFALQSRDGTKFHMKSFDCYARTEKRFLPLASKSGDGYTVRCTWSIPLAASGESMSGILAGVNDADVTYYRGFDYIGIR